MNKFLSRFIYFWPNSGLLEPGVMKSTSLFIGVNTSPLFYTAYTYLIKFIFIIELYLIYP